MNKSVLAAICACLVLASCAYIGRDRSPEPSPTVEIPTSATTNPTPTPRQSAKADGFVPAEEAQQLIRECGVSGDIAAYFRIPAGNDYHDHFPKMGKSPEIEGESGLFVVVYDGPVSGLFLGRPGASREPVTDALCVIAPGGEPNIYANASREGMTLPPGAFVRSPETPTPTALVESSTT
jgi:hypothetical protein